MSWDGQDRRRYERAEKRIRDAVIFTVGVAGSVNELWFVDDPRPYALAFLASLLGLPFILHADALRRSKNDDRDDEDRGSSTGSSQRGERP